MNHNAESFTSLKSHQSSLKAKHRKAKFAGKSLDSSDFEQKFPSFGRLPLIGCFATYFKGNKEFIILVNLIWRMKIPNSMDSD